MKFTIEDKTFETNGLTQLYPAAVVKTGYEDETTQVSLEWLDVESKGKVEVAGYGIFLQYGKEEKYSFIFQTRQELEETIAHLATQLQE